MEYTNHYHLPQWVESDRIQMEDFNQAMSDIETGLDTVKTEAETEQRTLAEALSQVSQNLGSAGKNARIQFGSYVGTGTYGASNPTSLQFDFRPVFLFIASDNYQQLGNSHFLWPLTYGVSQGGSSLHVAWSERGVSWYYSDSLNPHINQNNTEGYTYHYVAVGYDE